MRLLPAIAVLAMLLTIAACSSDSTTSTNDPITIEDAWARPVIVESMTDGDGETTEGEEGMPMGMGSNSAAYMMITNNSNEDDRVVSGSTDIATVELHQTSIVDGVASMQQMTEGMPIPAGETLTLEPGGYHVMLIGVKKSLAAGDTFDLTLDFEKAGSQTITVTVRQP